MSALFHQIFDTIIAGDPVRVLITEHEGEVLRTSLMRKLKAYKESMDKVGYLSKEMANSTIGMEVEDSSVIFSVRQKRPPKVYNFTIISKAVKHDSTL